MGRGLKAIRLAARRFAGNPAAVTALLILAGGGVGLAWLLWPDRLPGRQAAVLLCWLTWAGLIAGLHHRSPRRGLGR
ncbi:hypothetical protein ACIU1J_28725 [Azospirillum doebereinerae]|uniref:hypothetical protein n=1 Tax=Azospirillum doebereinerae TaxID=92933 RepID=UPI001EE5FE02|nr:hypothetical protein [Azospirillum doebereinerae]MCG5239398.1 hypothetical protein [Azospirillum doebereinerae]